MTIYSITYRFVALFSCLAILIGIGLPAGLQAKSHDHCDQMEDMNHPMPSSEDCPMDGMADHSEDRTHTCDIVIACACSIEQAPVRTNAPTSFLKVKVPQTLFTQLLPEEHLLRIEPKPKPPILADSYSPPLLFLANEAFLI